MSKRSKAPRLAIMKGEAVFIYTSVCCNVPAKKPPLLNLHDMEAARETSLGTWRCSACGKVCKCTRSLNKVEKKNNPQEGQNV